MTEPPVDAPRPPAPRRAAPAALVEDRQWQADRLPLMQGTILALGVFFFLATSLQLGYLQWSMRPRPDADLGAAYALLDAPTGTAAERMEAFRSRALMEMESHVVARRYHQANVLLMARVWRRYLGFITGMILAFVGAVFILGKMREPPSRLEAEGGGVRYALESASPGLWLTTLGVVLMLATILTHQNVLTEDRPVYVRPIGAPAPAADEADPLPIPGAYAEPPTALEVSPAPPVP